MSTVTAVTLTRPRHPFEGRSLQVLGSMRRHGPPVRPGAPGPAAGLAAEAIRVVDGDLGISGSVTGQREGFEGLVAEVALGQVGIILALEASRLARDNAAWYRLLDLAGVCDTLVADADGLYHPALFDDRLILGMKGILAESELHVLRARLEGGIKNKAARGELRRGLPVGLIWGEGDGEISSTPMRRSPACSPPCSSSSPCAGRSAPPGCGCGPSSCAGRCSKPSTCTASPDHLGRARLPCRAHHADPPGLRWRLRLRPHPRRDDLGPDGALRTRRRKLPRDQWEVLIPDHHPGFTDWDTYLANQARIGANIRPQASRRAPARSARAARCCRAWPPAAPAAASWPSSTAARPRRSRTTTARDRPSWSTAAGPGT